jgi:hypothetical protein
VAIEREIVEKLQRLLRRDPHDRELGFLISLAVREPFVVYDGERRFLRQLVGYGGSERACTIADVARALLAIAASVPPDAGG